MAWLFSLLVAFAQVGTVVSHPSAPAGVAHHGVHSMDTGGGEPMNDQSGQ
jgi:hypothetical protein